MRRLRPVSVWLLLVVVAGCPGPAPPPSPDTDLSRQVRAWAAAVDNDTRQQSAAQIERIAQQLADGTIPTIPTAIQQFEQALPPSVRDRVMDSYNAKESAIRMSADPRGAVVNFFTEVAAGLQ